MSGIEDELFVTTLLDPAAWIQKANDLLAVSAAFDAKLDEAWRDVHVSAVARAVVGHTLPVYLMLSSFAIENILKAFIVRSRRSEWLATCRSTNRIPAPLRSHDLVRLSVEAATHATTHSYREQLLRRLSRSATWYGRYPVPTRALGLGPERFSDGQSRKLDYTTGADVDEIRCLVTDLKQEYFQE